MQFNFHELIAHAARTRPLSAGTIVGSGTIANRDESRGSSCLAERRILEKMHGGAPRTPFVLAEMSRLTSGRTLHANIALLINNARLAAELATAMARPINA